jgi:hypothetical protein
MSTVTNTQKEQFKSESSIFSHPIQHPKATHAKFPTWSLIAILFVAFFILKSFIYIKDKKRHGL